MVAAVATDEQRTHAKLKRLVCPAQADKQAVPVVQACFDCRELGLTFKTS